MDSLGASLIGNKQPQFKSAFLSVRNSYKDPLHRGDTKFLIPTGAGVTEVWP